VTDAGLNWADYEKMILPQWHETELVEFNAKLKGQSACSAGLQATLNRFPY